MKQCHYKDNNYFETTQYSMTLINSLVKSETYKRNLTSFLYKKLKNF